MRRHHLTILLSAAAFAAPALAQYENWRPSDAMKDDDSIRPPLAIENRSNAAVEWFKVWDMLSRDERTELGEAAGDVKHDPGVKLDKKQLAACDKYRDYIDGLIRVSAIPDCEWGVKYEAGWMCLLPHLGFLRGSCRAIGMDAHRCLDEHNYSGAAERIAAIIHISEQTKNDKIIISALVGAAICSYANMMTDLMLKQDMVNPSCARVLLEAYRTLPKEDIFGCASAIQQERWLSVEWSRGHFTGPYAGLKFVKETSEWNTLENAPIAIIASMDADRFGADLTRGSRYYDAISKVWGKPDNGGALEELEVEMSEGQFGLVARIVGPAVRRFAKSIDKTRADNKRLMASLEAIVHANETPAPAPAK